MQLLRATALAAISASAILAVPLVSNSNLPKDAAGMGMDRSIKPGDDFYRYANGAWLKAVAKPDGATYDNRAILTEKASRQVSDLLHEAAASRGAQGTVEQKVGDYYASVLDAAGIEARGLTPLAGELAKI